MTFSINVYLWELLKQYVLESYCQGLTIALHKAPGRYIPTSTNCQMSDKCHIWMPLHFDLASARTILFLLGLPQVYLPVTWLKGGHRDLEHGLMRMPGARSLMRQGCNEIKLLELVMLVCTCMTSKYSKHLAHSHLIGLWYFIKRSYNQLHLDQFEERHGICFPCSGFISLH